MAKYVVMWLLDCMACIRSQRGGSGDYDWCGAVDASLAKDHQRDSAWWGDVAEASVERARQAVAVGGVAELTLEP